MNPTSRIAHRASRIHLLLRAFFIALLLGAPSAWALRPSANRETETGKSPALSRSPAPASHLPHRALTSDQIQVAEEAVQRRRQHHQ